MVADWGPQAVDMTEFHQPPIQAEHCLQLNPQLFRITASNPGMMTGPGTNSYLLLSQNRNAIIIDPGPTLAIHQQALGRALASLGAQLHWILCTHSHLDHSPGARALQAEFGGTIGGLPAPNTAGQDPTYTPDFQCHHSQVLELDDLHLGVIHTPGHASNHLCFHWPAARLLFTGDHIMSGSTVVIAPPDGDMAAYINSLAMLLEMELNWLAPAHGGLIERPKEAILTLIRHRQQREAKVISALKSLGSATLDSLTVRVYNDVASSRHGIARRSLLAHLNKLQMEGRVDYSGHEWRWLEG